MKLAFIPFLGLPLIGLAQTPVVAPSPSAQQSQPVPAAPAGVQTASEKGAALAPSIPPLAALPLRVPGYELRVLDVEKPAVFQIGDKVVEGRLPVFVYFPVELGARTEAIRKLRALYDNVVKLAGKQVTTPSDYRAILVDLDKALTELEAYPPTQPATASPQQAPCPPAAPSANPSAPAPKQAAALADATTVK